MKSTSLVIELLGTGSQIQTTINNQLVNGWELAFVFTLSTKVYAILIKKGVI